MSLELLSYCSLGLLLALSIWIIPKYNQLQTKVTKGIVWYLWFKCVFEMISTITSLLTIPNLPGFYLYTAIEGVMIIEIVALIPCMKWFARFKRSLEVVLVAGIGAESFFVWGEQFNTISRLVECVLLTAICFVTIMRIVFSPYLQGVFKLPEYWFLVSVMIALTSHFFIIQYINYSMAHESKAEARDLWLFNYVSIIVSNLLLFVGLWVTSKPIHLRK